MEDHTPSPPSSVMSLSSPHSYSRTNHSTDDNLERFDSSECSDFSSVLLAADTLLQLSGRTGSGDSSSSNNYSSSHSLQKLQKITSLNGIVKQAGLRHKDKPHVDTTESHSINSTSESSSELHHQSADLHHRSVPTTSTTEEDSGDFRTESADAKLSLKSDDGLLEGGAVKMEASSENGPLEVGECSEEDLESGGCNRSAKEGKKERKGNDFEVKGDGLKGEEEIKKERVAEGELLNEEEEEMEVSGDETGSEDDHSQGYEPTFGELKDLFVYFYQCKTQQYCYCYCS